MEFIDLNAIPAKQLREGIVARIVSGEKLMMAFMDLQPHLSDMPHHHPHEQCGVVLEGEMELTVGEQKKLLKAGDTYFIPSNVPHAGRTYDKPARVLDIFSPPREEYR
ncbi:MAG: cupin domain-containing protein [Nitrospinota bacterium]|nr:MAG: cupin domain-containing protein [Nitrospinota bacterium]